MVSLLLFNKVISQTFSKEQVGEYFAIMSYSTFFSLCLFAPFNQCFQREFHSENRIPIFNFLVFLLIPASVSILIVLAVDFENKILIIFLVLLLGFKDPFLGLFNQNFDKVILFWVNFSSGVGKLLLVTCPFLIPLFPGKELISAQAISILIIIVMSACFLIRKRSLVLFLKNDFSFIIQPNLYLISFPLMLTSLISWSRDMGVRSILSVKLTAADVASYSLMQGVSNLIPTFLLSVFSLYYLPKIFNGSITFRKAAIYVCTISIFSFLVSYVIFYFFGANFVLLFLDAQYISDGYLISSLLLPNFLFCIIGFLNSYFIFHRITSKLIIPNIVVASCLIIFMNVYIDTLGLRGVSWVISLVAVINILLIGFLVITKRSKNA
ncbi:membrane hypothetical protein [Vibrio nigripulchritudo SO65]|uniref:lipopolysaccharide biosynthesis protein n=1 Tax=Vibrio nigripulchritudo TaxID=28173 RepID=UPI0003B20402|nr:hypothetical protein [Vibrio nigripulchritudo]CCN41689.1 membrane hypothetical protein [Vibrio nigripulchritudo FTn2]CCN65068.1 membrane hypothetical protein [Vibrio nigripulchritudo POn4]CCN73996.1 membrane hypothetical protein [Vibrio nigripulchritudo SO65]